MSISVPSCVKVASFVNALTAVFSCRDDGVGLAAPQVGVNVRLMVFNESGKRNSQHEMVLINPKVVSSNRQHSLFEEGCLSFPRIFADVEVLWHCSDHAFLGCRLFA